MAAPDRVDTELASHYTSLVNASRKTLLSGGNGSALTPRMPSGEAAEKVECFFFARESDY